MPSMSRWVVGLMMAITGLFALYLASRAHEPIMYYTGIGFFVATVLFNYFQIDQVYDDRNKH